MADCGGVRSSPNTTERVQERLTVEWRVTVKGGCPCCGDSVQTLRSHFVSDHGISYQVWPVWCMDCKNIRALVRPTVRSIVEVQELYEGMEVPVNKLRYEIVSTGDEESY